MTKVSNGAQLARASVALRAAASVALVMLVGACTSSAPVAAPGGAAPAEDTSLFPLFRDTPSADGTTARRVGFVDQSGRLVVLPTYGAYQACPTTNGSEVVLAWGGGQLDALDDEGKTISTLTDETAAATDTPEIDVSTVVCGPLAGHATVSTSQGPAVVSLPDLTASGLPVGVALDESVIWVQGTEQGRPARASYLYDARTGTKTTLPADAASLVPVDQGGQGATGEWPVPVLDTKGKQRYLDKTGSWVSTQVFAQAGGFVYGHGWVSTGTSWHFVDTTATKTGRDYTSLTPLLEADGTVTGYQVTSATGGTRTGLVDVDLQVVVDPDTESAVCAQTTPGSTGRTCVATAADGTTRLVALPAGTSIPLPTGMTTALSDRLVTDATGSSVHNLTTGQTFDVPAPFHAETAWADAYVTATADNGLRTVLDGAGEVVGLGTITRQVTVDGGTTYFWAITRSRQGYVDATGDWLYHEARYTTLAD